MEENRLKFYDDIFPNTKKKKRRIFAENNELVTKKVCLCRGRAFSSTGGSLLANLGLQMNFLDLKLNLSYLNYKT